jgi:peroxiredoxin
VKSSLPATPVHTRSADVAFDAADADAHVACFRVVSVAAFEVPAAPGSPTCSLTHG